MWAHMHSIVLLMPYIFSIVPFQHSRVLFLFANTILKNIKSFEDKINGYKQNKADAKDKMKELKDKIKIIKNSLLVYLIFIQLRMLEKNQKDRKSAQEILDELNVSFEMTFLNHSNWIKINKDQSSPSTQIRSSNSLTIFKAFQMSK